jgi:hypothetical protein
MKHYFNIRNAVLTLVIVSISMGGLLSCSIKAQAQIPVTVTTNVSPTEILNTSNGVQNTIHLYAEHIKSWVLDGLAWHIAKMIVQRITASVVQWINSGFSGSPSFLTNPGGFFADVGDQVTGSFIANTGILSGLCSPFNIDVRLSIALGQAGYGKVEKYTCTLNTVIKNAENTTINGASIEGFMKGDYRQGGLPAFVEINLPSNNASGAYLKAQSDLNYRIASQQGQKQQQLNQGGGFLSWDSCSKIDAQTADSIVGQKANASGLNQYATAISNASNVADGQKSTGPNHTKVDTGDGTSVQTQLDPKTGAVTYQNCNTETPGSVINGQLEKSLGSGIDQLNLANSINEIVDALLAQLVNQVLQTGLGTVSSKPSGLTQSYIQQLSDEANATSTYSQDAQSIRDGFNGKVSNAQKVVDYAQQAVGAFNTPIVDYGYAQKCYQDLLQTRPTDFIDFQSHQMTANDALSSIASELNNLYADKQTYDQKLSTATTTLALLQNQANSAAAVSSPEDLQKASDALKQATENYSPIVDTVGLQGNVDTATNLAKSYDEKANGYRNSCSALRQTW